MSDIRAAPLYDLLRRIRKPVTLRELMASCLRHIYMGDPFSGDKGSLPPPPKELFEEVSASDVSVSGIRCVIYSPKEPSVGLLLYMHGGGFVIGCTDDTDYITRRLCVSTGLTVVSVNYRLAPETVFPGALEDCSRVLSSVIESRPDLQSNDSNIFFAGDSAGGNLAISLALKLKGTSISPRGLILFAPWLDMNVELYESYNRLAPEGVVFDAAFIGYARAAYVRYEDWTNPLASPLFCDPSEVPPTIMLVGSGDPLVDQSVRFAERARGAGCSHIELQLYEGMPHCFYSFPNLFTEEADCYQRVSEFFRKRLA